MKRLIVFTLIVIMSAPAAMLGQHTNRASRNDIIFSGIVLDALTSKAMPEATVRILKTNGAWALTDTLGRFSISIPSYSLPAEAEISFLGYNSLKVTIAEGSTQMTYLLQPLPYTLDEVVVTATEQHGVTSTSRIGRDAIRHIQPSSFADLLELIPGGRASDPVLNRPVSIHLREGSLLSNYGTSALGTRFLIDGVPLNNDANLQYSPVFSSYSSDNVNLGVDMRSLSTDDIESVEIVRGIPSVEHGDLTSGLVSIKRKKGGRNLEARLKADMTSKMFYIGKGFEAEASGLKMNIGFNFLDARADPRNTRQNYKRYTASYRINKEWDINSGYILSLNGSADYTGSFDNSKSDKDLDLGKGNTPIERYKSSYNRVAIAADIELRNKNSQAFFRKLNAAAAVTQEFSLIDQWKYVALGSSYPLSTATEDGDYDVKTVPYKYEATLKVDGKPLYAFFKTMALFGTDTQGHIGESKFTTSHRFKIGGEWNMDKNRGNGIEFDPEFPFSYDMNIRPRRYKDLPANHQLGLYLEDNSDLTLGKWKLRIMAGIRANTMLNVTTPRDISAGAGRGYMATSDGINGINIGTAGHYNINRKWYLDPRLNARLELPPFLIGGSPVRLAFTAGAGWHTKFPTLDQLYPLPIYYDITQFNYWPTDESKRRINVHLFKLDPTNYALKAARNFKWEMGADFQWNGFTLSVTWFRENMASGFRSSSTPIRFIYKDYDESKVDYNSLTGPPDLNKVPYVLDTLLSTIGITSNGSRTVKQGIEFTFTTKRINPIKTKITINGAWWRTRYSNSHPEYYRPSVVIGGKTYPYIGYYDDSDRYLRERFNTNVMFDTQIPRLGLIFSTSFQCLWFVGSKTEWKEPNPLSYIDKKLVYHPFTEDDAKNGIKSQMIRSYSSTVYQYRRIPISMNVNLKVTKSIYQNRIALAVFVNKILDYTPSYTTGNSKIKIRRYVDPYFGMELNFKF